MFSPCKPDMRRASGIDKGGCPHPVYCSNRKACYYSEDGEPKDAADRVRSMPPLPKAAPLTLTTFEEIYFGGIRLDPGTYEVRRVADLRDLPPATF